MITSNGLHCFSSYFAQVLGRLQYLSHRHCGLQDSEKRVEPVAYREIDIGSGRSIIVGLPDSLRFASAAAHLAALTLAQADSPFPPGFWCVVGVLPLRNGRVRLLPWCTRLAVDPSPLVARVHSTPVACRWQLG